ncbi:Vascular endothelial growth factor, heparin-binding domain,Cystine-knot cytokine,PDGF/VEGF domain [Cinara cedri]|uniref:Vascular endothelial growth factor, heparin-binding domain,Cystine-knot cytokine,PDGF/VEGF domain n=1 Tax=Cinara cedri TaxID=506608 RepID=A0A5E4MQH2_9HEMI|nr:Vascular endothelial growth factor, heparin-binding domain,Cystine-knot cytokine,PDGF/VEGF domain [Cinara cedri]
MFNKIILYYLLLAITITATLGRNDRFKVLKNKIVNRINKHEFKLPFCGNLIKTRDHQIKNYKEIPLNIITQLNKVTSISELFWKFLPHDDIFNVLYYTTNNNQNSSIIIPKAATCTTDYQVVSLRDDDDPSLYYSPPCTRVKRCGGCCGSNLVSCQPTKVEMLNFQVTILQYNETFAFKEKKIVTVEQHVACKCDCTIKEQDCNFSQVYNAKECRCVCNNFEDQDKCDEKRDIKMWDSESCSCQCMEVQECTSGFKFNYNTCSCEPTEDTVNPHN